MLFKNFLKISFAVGMCWTKNNVSFIARELGCSDKLSDVSEDPTYVELTLNCLYRQEG